MESYPWNTGAVVIVIVNNMVGIRNTGKNPNNGRNEINGKSDKIGMHGKNETNENRFPESPNHFANFFASQSIFCWTFRLQTLANVVQATWGKDRTPHGTQHTRIFSRCASCSTVVHVSSNASVCIGSRFADSNQHASRVSLSLRLLHLMSCRNLLGLPQRRSTFPDRLETESGIPCIDSGGGGFRVAEHSPLTHRDRHARPHTNEHMGPENSNTTQGTPPSKAFGAPRCTSAADTPPSNRPSSVQATGHQASQQELWTTTCKKKKPSFRLRISTSQKTRHSSTTQETPHRISVCSRGFNVPRRRLDSAPFDSSPDWTRVRTHPLVIKANEYVCMQHFKRASPCAIGFRSASHLSIFV